MWNSGSTPILRSEGRTPSGTMSMDCRAFDARLWWVSWTPFGFPVVDGDVVVRALGDAVVAAGETLSERGSRVGVAADGDDALDARVVAYLFDERDDVGERDDCFGAGVREQVSDFAALVLGVHRHDRTPRAERTVERDDELWEVREVYAYRVAGLDTCVAERGGELSRLCPKLPVG